MQRVYLVHAAYIQLELEWYERRKARQDILWVSMLIASFTEVFHEDLTTYANYWKRYTDHQYEDWKYIGTSGFGFTDAALEDGRLTREEIWKQIGFWDEEAAKEVLNAAVENLPPSYRNRNFY